MSARWIFIAAIYACGSAAFGLMQALYNRRYGMDDEFAASWWFVAIAWYPLLVWTLVLRMRARA